MKKSEKFTLVLFLLTVLVLIGVSYFEAYETKMRCLTSSIGLLLIATLSKKQK